MKHTVLITLSAAAILTLTSCSSNVYAPIDKHPGVTYEGGVPGGTVVETRKLNATVTAIDASSRKVTLVSKDGKKATVKCGPEVVNFDQIHVGDVVKAVVTDELTVAMAGASTPPTSAAEAVLLAPRGAKPGALMAETQQYTATVTAINLKRHQVTLGFPDGSKRTFTARNDIDLTQRKVGELVSFRVATAMAISVEKP